MIHVKVKSSNLYSLAHDGQEPKCWLLKWVARPTLRSKR